MGNNKQIEGDTQVVAYSSLGSSSLNPDGSRKVRCFQCREYIGSVRGNSTFNGALCLNCQRINRGEDPISGDIVYKNVYVPGVGDVPETLIFQKQDVNDPITGPQVVGTASRVDYVRKVLSTLNRTITGIIKKPKEPESRKVAREKKPPRIFADGIELGDKP